MMQAVIDHLAPAKKVLVLAHRGPDGDALGSTLGLMHLLRALGKEVLAYSAGPVPPELMFLPGLDQLILEEPDLAGVDSVVLGDCHQSDRAGEAAAEFLPPMAQMAAVIDHHEGVAEFGAAPWVDPGFAATSEMVALMAQAAGWEITPQAATCLYVGILTDTGSFRYGNTSPRVLRVAADLVEAGADPWQVSQEVYATRPQRFRLMGRVLEGLEFMGHGSLALGQASLSDLADLGVEPKDMDQMVEVIRGIPGVEVAVLLKELEGGGVKLSMRSRGLVDVAAVAMGLGGGGHKRAAGARMDGSLQQARQKVAEIFGPFLSEQD